MKLVNFSSEFRDSGAGATDVIVEMTLKVATPEDAFRVHGILISLCQDGLASKRWPEQPAAPVPAAPTLVAAPTPAVAPIAAPAVPAPTPVAPAAPAAPAAAKPRAAKAPAAEAPSAPAAPAAAPVAPVVQAAAPVVAPVAPVPPAPPPPVVQLVPPPPPPVVLTEAPAALLTATSFRQVMAWMRANVGLGFDDATRERIVAKCEELRPTVPAIGRLAGDLPERVKRALQSIEMDEQEAAASAAKN